MGTVRHKNQVNALVKILTDFGFSAMAYFFVGYWVAYGVTFFSPAAELASNNGYELVKFFFLMTFAAAIPAIVSGGIAERAKFWPFLIASSLIVAFVYPFFEGIIWNGNFGFQAWLEESFGAPFHDFAGSVVVHGVGGWLALVAVLMLGIRNGRYKGGRLVAFPPSNIPFLALGSWILCIGWFGFNVMSAQTMDGISGLVAVNTLMAMVGGIITALQQNKWKIDDVLGVWPLHGVCGAWGAIACGVFGTEALGGLGGVSLTSQLIGTVAGISVALIGGAIVYGGVKAVWGLRLTQEEEYNGADLSIHKIESTCES